MPELSVYTVVREILTADPKLAADEVITRAKEKGVTKPDADIRKVVHATRTELKRKGKKRRRAPLSAYTLAREILTTIPDLATENVLGQIKAKGVTKPDSEIREAIRKMRGKLRRAKAAPVAARVTTEPKPASTVSDESAIFASLDRANKAAHLCGGVAKAREIAQAIRECGGIDTFLRRLDVVAGILSSETKL